MTIGKLAEHFGDNLFATLPNLWEVVVHPLEDLPKLTASGMYVGVMFGVVLNLCVHPVLSEQVITSVSGVLHALQVFEVLIPVIPGSLHTQVKWQTHLLT